MTGATPRESGEQTQPMACPPGPAARGPYADADTIDGPVPDTHDAGADWPDAARLPPRSGGPLLAWLWGEQGQAGEYLLASDSVTVGRDPGNDIVLVDPAVGGAHAKIEYCDGQWWLQPADSAGPTWVNGQPVQPGQRLPVTDGDRLRFGFHTQFRLLVPSAR
jgi:hypothetical protein